ncbi:hypothetical protein [Novacetimonas pomaceti]|uniref:hypothetical protein n=1 Tax=Novacetimonas pomaceti TaxID=2021998 RepID=UPI001C2D0E42|nr:hypothetical protein [Novacetimonas pomaceti]MBV1833008.1 hypothetical protein [Novacetimonas pomaceti]
MMLSHSEGSLTAEKLFENSPLTKNDKSFRVSPFCKKATSFEAFWEKLRQKLL